MSVTLFDPYKQIRNFTSPTGVFTPSGFVVSGSFTVSGTISGTSGNVTNVSTANLDVSGPIRSPYLSGIVGPIVSGSGIIEFVAISDSSGNNTHYYHSLHTGNRGSLIQAFSSQDAQDGWFYYTNNNWSAFPAIGLNSTEQQNSLVRHIFKATGYDIFTKYFNEIKVIYAGNITGNYVNSVQFQSPTVGFTVVHPNFESSTIFTGIGVSTGIALSSPLIMISGAGQIITQTIGSNTISVSGGGVNKFGLIGGNLTQGNLIFSGSGLSTSQTSTTSGSIITYYGGLNQIGIFAGNFSQGSIILSGGGNTSVSQTNTTSGVLFSYSGGLDSFALVANPTRQGNIIVTGAGSVFITETLTSSGALYTISGSGGGGAGGGVGNVTGIGVTISSPLFTGGFVYSGQNGITASISNASPGISGIVVGSNLKFVTGFGLMTTSMFNSGFVITGNSGVGVGLINLGNGISGFAITGYPYAVTGLGITGASPAFIQGGISLIPSGAVNIAYSGNNIIIGSSGIFSGTINNTFNTFTGSGSNDIVGDFFFDLPVTGDALSEFFYPTKFTVTGYSIACTTSGSGTFPLSGVIYQRDSTNVTGMLTPFTFEPGIFYKTSTISSVLFTGQNRLGVSIYTVLSGCQNLAIGLFGSGVSIGGAGDSYTIFTGGGVTGFSNSLNAPLYGGGLVVTGQGNVTVTMTNLGNNISGFVISGSGSSAVGGGVGNVTGVGVSIAAPLFTGGFVVSGQNGITASISNIAAGISGIIIGNLRTITGFGLRTTLMLGSGFIITGNSGVGVGMINYGGGISGFAITGYPYAVTGIGITGGTPQNLWGSVGLIGTSGTVLAYSGNNIIIGSTAASPGDLNDIYIEMYNGIGY